MYLTILKIARATPGNSFNIKKKIPGFFLKILVVSSIKQRTVKGIQLKIYIYIFYYLYCFVKVLGAHLLFQLLTFFLYIPCKTNTNKKFANFVKKCRGFLKFNDNRILLEAKFFNLIIPKSSLGVL